MRTLPSIAAKTGAAMRIAAAALVLVLLALAGEPVRAQDAGAFARMGFGARGPALGNALVADVSGDASSYYNPALAPYVPRQHLTASVGLMSFDRSLQGLQFAAPVRPRAGVAAAILYAGVDDIRGRTDSGEPTETFSSESYAFYLTFGTRLGERVAAGASFKLYQERVLDEVDVTRGVGIDLGVLARLTDRLHVGAAVGDLLAKYEWDTTDLYALGGRTRTDAFPLRLRAGAAYAVVEDRLRVLAEAEWQRSRREDTDGAMQADGRAVLRAGVAYTPLDGFALHVGADRLGAEGGSGTRPAAGFAVDRAIGQLPLRAAYTFVYEANVGDAMHLVGLTLFL